MILTSLTTPFSIEIDANRQFATLQAAVDQAPVGLYPNIVIFVNDVKRFYVLNDGAAGTSLSHWTSLATSIAKFTAFDSGATYVKGDAVYLGNVPAMCLIATSAGESPITHPSKWFSFTLQSAYVSSSFTNQTSIVVNHTITSPVVQVVDTAGNVLYPNILIEPTSVTVTFSEATSGKITIK